MQGPWTSTDAPAETDVIVLGSGVGGLTAALTASLNGLRRLSWSIWLYRRHERALVRHGLGPRQSLSAGQWRRGDGEQAARYLASLIGERGDPAMWRAFLESAPADARRSRSRAGIGFPPLHDGTRLPAGSSRRRRGGRALEPLPFDGRELGADFARLAWPIPELMLFGGMMVTRGEAVALLRADRSVASPWRSARGSSAAICATGCAIERGTRLVLGNALVARLLKACSIAAFR